MIKLINLKLETPANNHVDMNLAGFIEFVLQISYFLHEPKVDPPSVFLPILFRYLKDVSLNSDKPLF